MATTPEDWKEAIEWLKTISIEDTHNGMPRSGEYRKLVGERIGKDVPSYDAMPQAYRLAYTHEHYRRWRESLKSSGKDVSEYPDFG